MSAKIRIFVCTYQRPHLLRRALLHLLAQTFTDWVCELHNDDPDDDRPRMLLEEIAPGDQRFIYCRHVTNWGGVATFNHAYAGGPEPFAALLEDDNWWDPEFLERTLAALDRHPDAALAWANMQLWREEADGSWTNEEKQIWKVDGTRGSVVEFSWPEILQAFDALHSNGAAVFRPAAFDSLAVPVHSPFAIIESARERAAHGTLLFLPECLGHFARTRHSARSDDAVHWLQSKLLVAASFFSVVEMNPEALRLIWSNRRSLRPRDTDFFFVVALALRKPALLRPARLLDGLHFVAATARHPRRLWRALNFRSDHAESWEWMLQRTAGLPKRPMKATAVRKEIFTSSQLDSTIV